MLHQLAFVYVEDMEEDYLQLKGALKSIVHTGPLVWLQDGDHAMQYFSRSDLPALGFILIDVRIPGENSFAIARQVRTQETLRQVPVILISGFYSFEDQDKAYESGANLYMLKPSDKKGWDQLINRLFDYFSPSR